MVAVNPRIKQWSKSMPNNTQAMCRTRQSLPCGIDRYEIGTLGRCPSIAAVVLGRSVEPIKVFPFLSAFMAHAQKCRIVHMLFHSSPLCSMLLVQGRMLKLPLPSYQCSVIGHSLWCSLLTSALSFSISPVSMTCGHACSSSQRQNHHSFEHNRLPYTTTLSSYLLSLLVIACLLSSPATTPSPPRLPRIVTTPPHAPQSIVPDYARHSASLLEAFRTVPYV